MPAVSGSQLVERMPRDGNALALPPRLVKKKLDEALGRVLLVLAWKTVIG
jgi:hypothetical protein